MPFTPYHRFHNSKRLKSAVSDFRDKGTISDDCYVGFQRYHASLHHKLRSARFNIDRLEEKLTNTDIPEAANPSGDLMFEVNMHIDAYFHSCGSALDILAREVLVLFGEPVSGAVYFTTALHVLRQKRNNDPILSRLETPPWRAAFQNYRNASTHELILASHFRIDFDHSGESPRSTIVFPLPDDPRSDPRSRSYRNHPDALRYEKELFKKILRLINTLYGDIVQRAEVAGELPL